MRLPIIALEPADADGCLHGPIIGRGAHDEALPTAVSYTHLDVYKRQPLNRVAAKYVEAGDTQHMFIPNAVLGQVIGFACRFIPRCV